MIHKSRYTTVLSRILQEGESGDFLLVKKTIPQGKSTRTYSPEGRFYYDTYARDFPIVVLSEANYGVWMSDTPMEQESLRVASVHAWGHILIVGLGIGLLPTLLRRNGAVKTIAILEKEQDVANLVYRYIKTRKMNLIIGEAKEYLRTTSDRYDFIYIDIWRGAMSPILEGEQWAALASRCLRKGGEVRWWLQELHERVKDKLPKEPMESSQVIVVGDPCLICGKTLRYDYAGVCADCADILEISELFVRRTKK